MKKILIAIATLFSGYQAMSQCNAPVVNNFTPNTGFIGSTVTITGAYFETTPANNIVYFGATKANVVTASFGTLTVIVPVGATTAPISVTNSCNKTAYSAVSFNGIFCPTPLTSTTYQNTAQNLTGVYGAYNMVSQDMDLDGKPDVISCTTNGFTVAKNNSTPGTISFSAHNVAGGGSSVFVADLDGDGRREVISSPRVYRNLSTPGTLSFGSPIGIFGGYQMAAGDFNNDGLIDIVTESGGQMYVLRNTSTGPGVISFATQVIVGNVGTTCTGIQVADVDGDGKTDILASQGNANRAVSLRNNTTPLSTTMSFESPEFWASNGNYPYRCQIADFDKDGKIDLTTCNYNPPANTCIFRNTSVVGDISFATSVNLAAPQNNYRIQVGDVNGDGLPDILTKSLGVNVFSVYPNISTGPGNVAFGTRYDYTSSAMAEVSGMAIGDLDGDFVPDIATSGISSNAIRFHRNTSSQSDVTPPTAICKNITVALSPTGTAVVTAAMIDNGSSDACGIGSLQINNSASVTFTCANIGANTVTLKVIDRANNQSTCTAIVNVAPAAIIVSGQTTVCQGQTVTMNANQGDTYQWFLNGNSISGATNQTYVASQSGNYTVEVTNAGGCSGTSAPTAVTVNNNPTVNITPAGTASLCNGSIALTASTSSIYQWKLNGNNISGATQQTYNATSTGNYSVSVIDLFGCTANSNTVVVNNTPPEIAVSGNSTTINDGDNTPSSTDGTDFGSTGSGSTTFTINNSGSGVLAISSIGITGTGAANFSLSGITLPTTVAASSSTTFTITYASSVLSTSNAVVTINNNDCDEASYDFAVRGELNCTNPVVNNPGTVNASTSSTTCDAAVTFTASATGLPSPSVSYSFSGATTGSGSGSGSGSTFNNGTTSVTVSASNACGSTSETFDVVVTDNTAPSVTTQNITISLNASGSASIAAADVDNGSSDACGVASMSVSPSSFDCSNVGSNTVTLTVTDNNGNSSTGTATVTVEDNTAPSVTTQNITISLNASGSASIAAADVDNGSSDACGVASMSVSPSSFSCSNVGSNTVTLTVVDNNGNSSTGTATVTVEDNTAPSVTTQNATIYLSASGTASISTTDINNGSSDACGIASLSLSKTSFNCSDVGNNTVTLTVVDNNGNSNTGTATVTVVDNVAPNAVAQNVTVTLSGGTASVTAAQINNGSSDACGIASMSVSPSSFNCSNIGNNTVTLTVTDVNGNSSTATATVNVVGIIPSTTNISVTPSNNTFTGGIPTTIYLGYGPQSVTLSSSNSTGGSSIAYNWSTASNLSCTACQTTVFSPTAQGNFTKTVTVTNNFGCTSSKSVVICVIDARATGSTANNPKVFLCHLPPGNPNNPQTLNISINAVPAHLGNHAGDRLGACNVTCGSLKGGEEDAVGELFTFGNDAHLVVYPNPSADLFRFIVESENSVEPVNVVVYNATGQRMETISNQQNNVEFEVGASLPQGIYFAEVRQGEFKQVVRIVKIR